MDQPEQKNPVFSLGKGMSLVGRITGYIIAPLLVFGAIGYWLNQKYDNIWFLVGALVLAFFASNYIIYRQVNQYLDKFKDEMKKKT